jgi:hypothetical protein
MLSSIKMEEHDSLRIICWKSNILETKLKAFETKVEVECLVIIMLKMILFSFENFM